MSQVDGALGDVCAVGAVIALWSAGVGTGMNHSLREALAPLRRGGLLRVVLVDVVVLPPLVWTLAKLFQVPSGYTIGLIEQRPPQPRARGRFLPGGVHVDLDPAHPPMRIIFRLTNSSVA